MLVETFASMLVAPIMMLLHTQFVVTTFLGKKVHWNAQERDDCGVSLTDAISVHYWHTLLGMATAGLVWFLAPALLPWLSPVLIGLILAIPLSMLLGSVRIGKALARRKLLLIPEEVVPTGALQYRNAALARIQSAQSALVRNEEPFVSVLQDPTFYSLHVGILRATNGDKAVPADQQRKLGELIRAGPSSKSRHKNAAPSSATQRHLNGCICSCAVITHDTSALC